MMTSIRELLHARARGCRTTEWSEILEMNLMAAMVRL
jgi:hypothetical protein